MKALVAQSRLTLCDPMDCYPLDSSVYGVLQARILEWAAISFSRGSSNLAMEPASSVSLHFRWLLYLLSLLLWLTFHPCRFPQGRVTQGIVFVHLVSAPFDLLCLETVLTRCR